jgi:hypothetical protein
MQQRVAPFQDSLESLDRVKANALFQEALTTMTPIEAVEQLVVPALERIGAAWHNGQLALSQV